ncbi:conserved unknown protein [Ectocarpus siliculosus]|uniref:glutamine--fructose-6-phosphate transaminase (isomerizing) n=1 Tax=Ectocarpus siliculosus TaxID=2880 RepID=D7G5I8_ECTSI|nr:conserved unknown protein [Ectocarpus siliculosus]|eukprot:CBJ27311.1 conserved unknown protein [Ectocarpus siliculosus]
MFLGRASSRALARSASAARRRPRTALPRPSLSVQQHPRSTAAAVATAREDRSSGEVSSGSYMWAAAAAVAALGLASTSDQQAECCGIMGVVSTEHATGNDPASDARALLLEGLAVLRNRGYDSAGMATSSPDGLMISKYASRGGKTDQNAHPHTDFGSRIALVHNGTINNAHDLRGDLERKGITFKSETDTEVIAHLVGLELDSDPNMDLKVALAKTVAKLDGTWGLAVIAHEKPDELVVACNGSPMVIGLGTDHIYVASETAAFNRHTKNFIAMQDGEIAVITPTECSLDKARMELAPDHGVESTPDPHAHWTLYEALQQPMAIARALAFGGRMTDSSGVVLGGLDRNMDKLSKIRNLMFAACGTSLYASQYGAKLMRDMGAVDTCNAQDAAELRVQDIPKSQGGIIAVSQSGETRDTLKALKAAEMVGIPRLSVVNVVGSAIARETKMGVYLNAGRETAVASTKAFTTLHNKSHCFVLGKGYGEPVAMEGALKLKEMSYIHAEGYSGGALKHGPFALIEGEDGPEGSTPVIMLILDDEHAHQMRTAGMEVTVLSLMALWFRQVREAEASNPADVTDMHVMDKSKLMEALQRLPISFGMAMGVRGKCQKVAQRLLAEGLDDDPIVIPSNDRLTALIGVLPLQLIAYELALLKGINPDTPRNLAKAVTTD